MTSAPLTSPLLLFDWMLLESSWDEPTALSVSNASLPRSVKPLTCRPTALLKPGEGSDLLGVLGGVERELERLSAKWRGGEVGGETLMTLVPDPVLVMLMRVTCAPAVSTSWGDTGDTGEVFPLGREVCVWMGTWMLMVDVDWMGILMTRCMVTSLTHNCKKQTHVFYPL